MLIALHIDVDDWTKLLGIWAAPEGASGSPEHFYPEPDKGLAIGLGRMGVKGDSVPWSSFFWRLLDASPYSAVWDVKELDADAPLSELFPILADEVVEGAEARAKAKPSPFWQVHVPGVTIDAASLAQLSVAVGGPASTFEPEQRLSTLCAFFADAKQMVVVARQNIDQTSADLALAWGLAYRGDRDLSIVLPDRRSMPSRVRAPWLVPPVRIFTYADGAVSEPPPLTGEESVACFSGRTWSMDQSAVLGDKADWVRSVLDWASIAPRLDRVERSSYVAWHVAGRQILKITPSAKKLTVVAGVDSTKPEDWDPPVKVSLTEAATDDVQHALVAAAAKAAAARLTGDDSGHREHRMQASLHPAQVGLAPGWRREFPAWRPGSNRAAFIDFLAREPSGRLHVVETKIGPDAMLVLQGLDYWLWCRANADHANAAVGAKPGRLPVVSYVVAPKHRGGEPISIYTAAQAEALHRDVEWRFVVVEDADTTQQVTVLPRWEIPANHRRAGGQGPRWAVRLQHHLTTSASDEGQSLNHGHSYKDPRHGLVPAAIDAYEKLHAAGLTHGYVGHVRSSQAFALNLLAPLTVQDWTAIARHHLDEQDLVVSSLPEFEYTDPEDALAERTKASPHATQVDCLVRAQVPGRGRHVLLIEVKLSEDSFSTCSAYMSPRNPRRSICVQPGPFGDDPTSCFQLTNHDREHRRRYDLMLGEPTPGEVGFGCWFRDGTNQAMRNLALAHAMTARGEAETASLLLMAPDGHATIWAQWTRHVAHLSHYDGVVLGSLPASNVVAFHPAEQARTLTSRYLLPADRLDVRVAQRLVDQRFADGAALIRLNGDGTERYRQELERIEVVHADADHVTATTEYPAGPFTHRFPRTSLVGGGDVALPDPDGDGSRLFTNSTVEANAWRLHQRRHPWWTAPWT